MSNARYFADGVDFWRVKYEDESTDGPYISLSSAVRQGRNQIKVRSAGKYYTMHEGRVVKEWQNHTEYKIQKLMPVLDDCLGLSGHEMYLEWVDVDG